MNIVKLIILSMFTTVIIFAQDYYYLEQTFAMIKPYAIQQKKSDETKNINIALGLMNTSEE